MMQSEESTTAMDERRQWRWGWMGGGDADGSYKNEECSTCKQKYDGRYEGDKYDSKKFGLSDDGLLPFPDFQSDAKRLIETLPKSDDCSARIKPVDKMSTAAKDYVIDDLIDARINSLSGLFRARHPKNWPHQRLHSPKRRATDMSEKQLVDWVLRGACSEEFFSSDKAADNLSQIQLCNEDKHETLDGGDVADNAHHAITDSIDTTLEIIAKKCQSRREELRRLAKDHLASSRREVAEFGIADLGFIDGRLFNIGFPNDAGGANDEGNNNGQNSVHIDRYGRLVRSQAEPLNGVGDGQASDDNPNEGSGNDSKPAGFVDASEVFWTHLSLIEDKEKEYLSFDNRTQFLNPIRGNTQGTRQLDQASVSQLTAPTNQNPQFPAAPRQALLGPPQLNQAQQREMSEQMDTDARQAIERALERYRTEAERRCVPNTLHHIRSTQDSSLVELSYNSSAQVLTNDDREYQDRNQVAPVFEIIHIPLTSTVDEANDSWWSWISPFHRQQRRVENRTNRPNVAGGDNTNHDRIGRREASAHRLRQHRLNEQEDANRGGWLDLRLALRRICFAVTAVVAAFIIIMMQGLPVDFGDDTFYVDSMEVNDVWLSGLMGPHFPGHHQSSQMNSGPAGTSSVVEHEGNDAEESDQEVSPFSMFWLAYLGINDHSANVPGHISQIRDRQWIEPGEDDGQSFSFDFEDWTVSEGGNEDHHVLSCQQTHEISDGSQVSENYYH